MQMGRGCHGTEALQGLVRGMEGLGWDEIYIGAGQGLGVDGKAEWRSGGGKRWPRGWGDGRASRLVGNGWQSGDGLRWIWGTEEALVARGKVGRMAWRGGRKKEVEWVRLLGRATDMIFFSYFTQRKVCMI